MATQDAKRSCGACTLCCTVLRVDELDKLGGTPCAYLRRGGDGCSIHERRPEICRAYRCHWLQGGLEEDDRPDRLGAVIDLRTASGTPVLEIRQAMPESFERSPRLREIAESFRAIHPVRISDVANVMDPEREYRLLLPGGEEQRVRGDTIEVWRDGALRETRRRPWLERVLRRVAVWRTARKLRSRTREVPYHR